jgi:UDP-GlcNAc:undecaprenyl-phosphate GlcNAc-1-phosphate transferase
MSPTIRFALPMAVALLAALPLRRVAVRFGILDHPGERKLQASPVPYLGGACVLLGAGVGSLIAPAGPMWGFLALLAGAQALGLVDDVRGLRPRTKLFGQVALALAAIPLGLSLRLTHLAPLDGALTVAWLVGIANAFNLLDNMDGLCGTIAVVACVGLSLLAPSVAPLALPLAGAASGFLVVNLPPARMYLGDAGSLTVGFGVGACTVLVSNTAGGPNGLERLVLPVAIALFDTSLVISSRLRAGRPIQKGGLDHFSHRLRLLLGWDRRLVLAVAALAAAAGPAAAWALGRYPDPVAWLAALIASVFAAGWLALLLRLDPYRRTAERRPERARV